MYALSEALIASRVLDIRVCVYVCVSVCGRERERAGEREGVCVIVFLCTSDCSQIASQTIAICVYVKDNL